MRSALITVSVLVCVFAGALLHLQAAAGAASATAAVKAEVSPIYLMGAAHIPGFNDTQWRTSLEVCNFGGVSRSIELGFLHRDQGNPVPDAVELTLASGQCVNYPDAVVSIFGYDEAVGTIRLVADGDGVVAVARTYNDTPDGTYGTALGSNPVEEAAADGASTVLVHLAQSASDSEGFRTNLDLLNVTDLEIAVEIALYTSAGSHYGTLSTTLEPFEYSQETRVFRQVSGDEVTDGYAVVRTATPGGAVMAAASLVDNRTGDTTTISGSAVPTTERWLDAVNMGTVINTSQSEWYPVLARDGSFMIFVSDRFGGYGSGDLYISRFVNGEWQAPQNLGPDVNSSGFESAPYLSADGSTLYFTSDGIGGGGNFDIWYCSLTNGVPGPRTRMPSPISTVAIDCCPVLSADGDTLYICSNRSGGFGSLDVWASHRVGGALATARQPRRDREHNRDRQPALDLRRRQHPDHRLESAWPDRRRRSVVGSENRCRLARARQPRHPRQQSLGRAGARVLRQRWRHRGHDLLRFEPSGRLRWPGHLVLGLQHPDGLQSGDRHRRRPVPDTSGFHRRPRDRRPGRRSRAGRFRLLLERARRSFGARGPCSELRD